MNERLLPPGLIVEQELTSSNDAKFGIRRFIVRDERWNTSHPPQRQVQVFPEPGRTDWGAKLRERLVRLFELPLPHVSRPLEIAATVDGRGSYVVTDWTGCTLAMRIAERGLVDDPNRALAWKLFGQLAEGLAALHRAGLPHGALCPGCVGVELTHEIAWIEGAAWGPLRHWTAGDYVASEAIPYQAPECQGRSQGPSEKADLYALGRIGIEMLCGSLPKGDLDLAGTGAAKTLGRVGNDSIRRKLLLDLVAADATNRPGSAVEVVKRLHDAKHEKARKRQRAAIIVVATCAMIALAYLEGCFVQMRAARNAALAQADDDAAQRNNLANDNSNLKQEKKKLEDKLAKRSKDGPPVGPTAEQEAAKGWSQYASNSALNFDTMRTTIKDDGSIGEQARQKMLAWRAEFAKAGGGIWRLRVLSRSKCQEGSVCIRSVDLVIGDKRVEVPLGDDPREWTGDFNWTVGQPIRVELYQIAESKGWWPFTGPKPIWAPVGAKDFPGPIPLWHLKKYRAYADDGKAWVEIEIDGCPGPEPDQQPEADPKKTIRRISSQLSEGK